MHTFKEGGIQPSAMFDLMNGVKKEIIIKKSQVSVRTFQFWIQRFIESGIDALINKPKSRHPKILSKKNKMIIDLLKRPEKV
jgi:transposase